MLDDFHSVRLRLDLTGSSATELEFKIPWDSVITGIDWSCYWDNAADGNWIAQIRTQPLFSYNLSTEIDKVISEIGNYFQTSSAGPSGTQPGVSKWVGNLEKPTFKNTSIWLTVSCSVGTVYVTAVVFFRELNLQL